MIFQERRFRDGGSWCATPAAGGLSGRWMLRPFAAVHSASPNPTMACVTSSSPGRATWRGSSRTRLPSHPRNPISTPLREALRSTSRPLAIHHAASTSAMTSGPRCVVAAAMSLGCMALPCAPRGSAPRPHNASRRPWAPTRSGLSSRQERQSLPGEREVGFRRLKLGRRDRYARELSIVHRPDPPAHPRASPHPHNESGVGGCAVRRHGDVARPSGGGHASARPFWIGRHRALQARARARSLRAVSKVDWVCGVLWICSSFSVVAVSGMRR